MGVRATQFFLLLMGLLFCSVMLAKQSAAAASPPHLPTAKSTPSLDQVERSSNKGSRHDGAKKLQISMEMPQMDVVNPTTTIPVINPTTTPGSSTTTTTPVYNPFQSPSYPTVNPATTPSMATTGQVWCVASQNASPTALQVALDYACGYGGADCSAIQPGGSCYNPDTVRDHASYAFNNYYQKNPIPTSCDFGGTASVTSQDPSTSTCQYPSSSGTGTTTVPVTSPPSPTTGSTTTPTGSTIYGGSVPSTTTPTGSSVYDGSDSPTTSGSVPVLRGMRLVVTLTCLLVASMAR